MDAEPASIFHGLPLTSEQDSEIRHYIHGRQRSGLWTATRRIRAASPD
jgi:hypothetical protein